MVSSQARLMIPPRLRKVWFSSHGSHRFDHHQRRGGDDPTARLLSNIAGTHNFEFKSKDVGMRVSWTQRPAARGQERGGVTKRIYYAKAGRAETVAKLDLEPVPMMTKGNIFVLLFLGSPLLKAELTITGPAKWEKPLVTDDQGRVTLPTPWTGRYVLEVIRFDEKPGGSGNEKFNRTRHISSLSFVQQDEIRWTENGNSPDRR
jgi:hypothetical protein